MRSILLGLLFGSWCLPACAGAAETSHPPMRPLPVAAKGELATGPKWFVDAAQGDDVAAGTEAAPWKSLRHALRKLKPGDTLYLRGGTYYEKPSLSRSGTEAAAITIAAYPGELAVIDGGLREFFEEPEKSWQPISSGAPGEYVSTRTYLEADDHQAPRQFLPGSWEPMWGIEDERPLALGHFGDSMVPLHGYRILADLRSSNELWIGGKKEMRDTGLYGGPGLWFDRSSGRIHIRLAHHRLEGLGDRAYRGPTDPRTLRLVVAAGFGPEVLRISGVRHVHLKNLVLRGATGSPMIHVYGSENVVLDHVSVFGGFPGLLVNASKGIRVTHSAFRGLAAPWTSRGHMKYRGTASYQIVLQSNQPLNEDIEFANCEFTDDHDFAYLRHAKNLRLHHSFIDNFNDDGLECGAKLRSHTMFVSQNRIGACLIPITQHEIDKDDSPKDHDSKAGLYLFRNVIDLRAGTYTSPPGMPDPTGAFLHQEGHMASDHGSPTWVVMHVYHNTLLRRTPVFRDSYLFGLGAGGAANSERDVFNNLFIQTDKMPGVNFVAIEHPENIHEGGNLIWGLRQGPELKEDVFAKFRSSRLFAETQRVYGPGWTTGDRAADPRFVKPPTDDWTAAMDLRLQKDSPALDGGLPLPAEWPDPLRGADPRNPDIGVLPRDAEPWTVGVDSRIPLWEP